MDPGKYMERFHRVRSWAVKEALLAEAKNVDDAGRRLFSRKRDSWEVPELDDPYKELIKVFDDDDRGGRARFTSRKIFQEEQGIPRLFRRSDEEQRNKTQPITVPTLRVFREQFLRIFAVNGLQFINWSNLVAAGGSVAACVLPIPKQSDRSAMERRKFSSSRRCFWRL